MAPNEATRQAFGKVAADVGCQAGCVLESFAGKFLNVATLFVGQAPAGAQPTDFADVSNLEAR